MRTGFIVMGGRHCQPHRVRRLEPEPEARSTLLLPTGPNGRSQSHLTTLQAESADLKSTGQRPRGDHEFRRAAKLNRQARRLPTSTRNVTLPSAEGIAASVRYRSLVSIWPSTRTPP
jgi:hypothetical protein